MSRTLEERQGRLKGLVVPPQTSPVWNPEARITMGSDMPAETCYHIMELLSDPPGPEWEASRQIIEHENKDNCSRACGLWGRPDLRPKISAKQKKAITTRNRPLDLSHLLNASRLDVQVPTEVATTTSADATQGEHSPEVSTPVPTTVNTPRTPEVDSTFEAQESVILTEGSTRKVSLSEPGHSKDTSPRARHSSAA